MLLQGVMSGCVVVAGVMIGCAVVAGVMVGCVVVAGGDDWLCCCCRG